jgi:parvulin-like peptidyl-prolyl isomerase
MLGDPRRTVTLSPRHRPLVAAALGALAVLAAQPGYRAATHWWATRGALVVVDGHAITRADLERELARRGSAQALDAAGRAVLDDMVELEVLAAAATKAGYADDPEVRRDVKHALAGRYREEHIERPLSDIEISDGAVEAYYQDHLEHYTLPEAARAAIIFLSAPARATEEQRHEIAARAEEVRQQALADGEASDFGALAVRHSDDQASRYRGGDIGWLSKGQEDSRHEPAVIEAIFALQKPGEIAPLLSTAAGVYIVKLIEKKAARPRPLAKVFEEIRRDLLRAQRREREHELYARLQAQVAVRVDEQQIAALGLSQTRTARRAERAPEPWAGATR